MLALYHDWDSLCSFKVRVCLAEKGLDWTERLVRLETFDHLKPDYLRINPNAVVPALDHDGRIVVESSVINEYLDDVFPTPALKPDDPYERARMRIWVKYQDDVIHHAVRPATFQLMIKLRVKRLGRDKVEELVRNHPMPERAVAYRDWATGETDLDAVRGSIAKFNEIIDRMDRSLAQGPWLAGGTFSLADCAVASFVDRVEHLRMAALWRDRPRVADWVARIKARPSYAPSCPPPGQRLPRPEDAPIAALALV